MNRNRLRTACIGSAAILIGINSGAWISALVPEEVRMLWGKALATAFFFLLCAFTSFWSCGRCSRGLTKKVRTSKTKDSETIPAGRLSRFLVLFLGISPPPRGNLF